MSQSLAGMPGAWIDELDEIAEAINAGQPHGTVYSTRPSSPSPSLSTQSSGRSFVTAPSRSLSPSQISLPPSRASTRPPSPSQIPLPPSRASTPPPPDMLPRLAYWEWKGRVNAFWSVDTALEISTGIMAAGMAGKNVPVAWWAFAPIVGAGYEIYDKFKRRDPGEAKKEHNPLLETYYKGRPVLTDRNLGTEHSATVDYLRRASVRVGVDAASATVSLVGGHYQGYLGKGFNSLIHGPASLGAVYTLARASWMLVQRLSAVQRADDQDLVNTWIAGLIGLKFVRTGFRITHSLLPKFENQTILSILAGATAVKIAGTLTIGGYIDAMASHIHFKAYEEQGYLVQFPLRPPQDIEAQIPARGREAGPNSALIFMLFEDALVQATIRNIAPDIIRDPAGWLAISHRLSLT